MATVESLYGVSGLFGSLVSSSEDAACWTPLCAADSQRLAAWDALDMWHSQPQLLPHVASWAGHVPVPAAPPAGAPAAAVCLSLDGLLPAAPAKAARASSPLRIQLPDWLSAPPGLGHDAERSDAPLAKRLLDVDLCRQTATPATTAPSTPASSCGGGETGTPTAPAGEMGLTVRATEAGDMRAEWRVAQLSARLKAGKGKPLVSPLFDAAGVPGRLMIFPDPQGLVGGVSAKKRQSNFVKMVTKGPLSCTLKMKVPSSTPRATFVLTLGSMHRFGPFVCNSSEQTMCGPEDINVDWFSVLDKDGSVLVGVEISEGN